MQKECQHFFSFPSASTFLRPVGSKRHPLGCRARRQSKVRISERNAKGKRKKIRVTYFFYCLALQLLQITVKSQLHTPPKMVEKKM